MEISLGISHAHDSCLSRRLFETFPAIATVDGFIGEQGGEVKVTVSLLYFKEPAGKSLHLHSEGSELVDPVP